MKRATRIVFAVCALTVLGSVATVGPAGASTRATNGKILVNRTFGSYYTINPDGSQRHKVVAPKGLDVGCGEHSWSPDSSKLLFCAFRDRGIRPATANPDGSGFTLLDAYPNRRLSLACVYWSPNGARLLCHWDPDDVPDPQLQGMYTVRSSDGGGLKRLNRTPRGYNDAPLGYTPDGSRIAFWRETRSNGHAALYTMRSNGTRLRRLSAPGLSISTFEFWDSASVSWSPSGSRVAFAAIEYRRPKFTTALFVANADGSGQRQIAPTHIGALSAQWSPTGKRIGFTSCCAGNRNEAWTVRPDGTGRTQITHSSQGTNWLTPAWSPDGRKLLLQRSRGHGTRNLWKANPDGTGLSKLVNLRALTNYDWGSAPTG